MADVACKRLGYSPYKDTVEDYIAASTEPDSEGAIERASDQADNVAYALGRLVDALAEKGILCQADIERVAGRDAPKITELRRNSDVNTQEV